MNIFIGYDPRQPIASQTLMHSIWNHASIPVNITRLQLSQLPITRRGLTEFTYSRFLVPFLSEFQGTSVFLDSDMLCLDDITELLAYPLAYPEHPVFVVKNVKRFEWPSMMVFNNALCTKLTPAFVNDEKNILFDFSWATSVGELPSEWNHLIGYDPIRTDAKIVHFTQGIPCWEETKRCEYAEKWKVISRHAISSVSFNNLMGKSVHAEHVRNRMRLEGVST